MADNESQIRETLKRLLDAFNRHDVDAIMEHFADDATLDMPRGPHPWGQRFVGHAQVREGLAGRFKGLPDVRYGDARDFVSGNMAFSERTLTGTKPSGERIETRETDHWEFRDGKVVRKDSYWKIVEK